MANDEQYNQETKDSKLMIDHDYDGIRELNNPPPAWLMYIFYASIVWSVFYVFYYHIYDGPTQIDEYNTEMAEAEALKPVNTFDESNIVLLTDDAAMTEGLTFYSTKACDACHGASNIGPNLTDNFWINGGTVADVFKIIKYGKAAKGMTAFQGQMTDEQINQLASYVLVKLKGAETTNSKGPEGEEYK